MKYVRTVLLAFVLMAPLSANALVVSEVIDIFKELFEKGSMINLIKKQLDNQVDQLKNDLEYYKNQQALLDESGWKDKDKEKLDQHLKYIESLEAKVASLTLDYRKLEGKFNDLYGLKDKPFEEKIKDWRKQSEESIKNAMKSHGIKFNSKERFSTLSKIVKKQESAKGTLAAIRALTRIAEIQSHQLEELKTLILHDSRAKQSVAMEKISNEKVRRAYERKLMSNSKKRKSKYPPMKKLPMLGEGVPGRK